MSYHVWIKSHFQLFFQPAGGAWSHYRWGGKTNSVYPVIPSFKWLFNSQKRANYATEVLAALQTHVLFVQMETLINTGADLMSTKALLNASVSRGAFKVEELRGRLCVCVCVCVWEFHEWVSGLTRDLGVFVICVLSNWNTYLYSGFAPCCKLGGKRNDGEMVIEADLSETFWKRDSWGSFSRRRCCFM